MTLHDVRPEREVRSAGPPARGRTFQLVGLLLVAAAVGALLARFLVAGTGPGSTPSTAAATRGPAGAAADLLRAQTTLRNDPDNPGALTNLGLAYLNRAKETADPTYYTKAGSALDRSARLRPRDLRTTVGLGLLDLSRHEFRRALARGRAAERIEPASADAVGVVVDAQVELGDYSAAAASAQHMVDLKPNLSSYARVSYLRELQGDADGAISAMTTAVNAGAGSPADVAYVQTLLGDLLQGQGQLADAAGAYRAALASVPGYGAAEVGTARLEAARGQLPAAAARLARVSAALPLPETVALYGDVLAAQHRDRDATAQYALVRVIERLQTANAVVLDFESARFAADHARDPGADPAATVRLARAALANRPTIYAHDTLGWALRQARQPAAALREADSALRFGTRDSGLYYHRAVIRADLGRTFAARADLRTAFAIHPTLTVRDLPAARTLAAELGVPVPAAAR